MRSKNAFLLLVLTLASLWLCSNCATLIEQKTQQIPVTSAPAGATVTVNGQPLGATPLEIRLARKVKDQVVRIESAGYNPYEIRIKRGVSTGAVIMDVLSGAALGVVAALLYEQITNKMGYSVLAAAVPAGIIFFPLIDAGSGKIYKLNPAELTVTLTKVDGPPRVDTMTFDAGDLQNVKWIRVRRDE